MSAAKRRRCSALIDNAEARSVFWITGLIAFATIATALLTGSQSRKRTVAN